MQGNQIISAVDDTILYKEKPKNSTKTISKFRKKMAEYKINI